MTFRTLSKTKRWILKCLLTTLPFMPCVPNMNNILKKLSSWCLKNSLTAHLGKTEYMLLGYPKFNSPFQEIRFGNATIKRMYSKSCLGLKIDSFTQKLNLLKSFYLLPLQERLVVGKSIFDELERIHIRAARIIYGLAWDRPSQTIQESVKWKPLKLLYHLKLLRERTDNFRKTNCLRLPKPRLDLMKKSIFYQGALLWNSLSNDDSASNSLTILKNSFRCLQLNDWILSVNIIIIIS